MATLRNLRNMQQANIDIMVDALSYLQNPRAVENSKQLPFRFLSAYKMLQKENFSGDVLDAIENAMTTSIENLPRFTGRTFVMTDNSGSMSMRTI